MRVSLRRFFLGALVVAASAACGVAELPELPLEDGRTVESLVAGQDSVTLLLVDPADCLLRDARVAGWLEQRNREPRRLRLVFTRKPDSGEEAELVRHRIVADGMIGASWRFANLPHPAEFFFVRGAAVRPPT